jgi:hypothetical protein
MFCVFYLKVYIFVKNLVMNLQSIIVPIGELFQWFFKHMLVPSLALVNTVCIIGGFFGIWLWLRMQKKFTAKAKQEGTIV